MAIQLVDPLDESTPEVIRFARKFPNDDRFLDLDVSTTLTSRAKPTKSRLSHVPNLIPNYPTVLNDDLAGVADYVVVDVDVSKPFTPTTKLALADSRL